MGIRLELSPLCYSIYNPEVLFWKSFALYKTSKASLMLSFIHLLLKAILEHHLGASHKVVQLCLLERIDTADML